MNQMIIGYIAAALVIGGFILWNFVFKKKSKSISKSAENKVIGSLSPRQPTISSKKKTPSRAIEPPPVDVPIPKYRAMVWTDDGIIFKKIPEKVGVTFFCDPSMPEKGEHLWVTERKDHGKMVYEPFDPREIPIISKETPEWAYDSTHCFKVVFAWFKNKADLWDKVNTILIGLGMVIMGLVSIVGLDKVFK